MRVYKPETSAVPFPLDIVMVQPTSFIVAGQDGVYELKLKNLEKTESPNNPTTQVEATQGNNLSQAGWNFDIVHQPIKGSDGVQIHLGSVEISSSLPPEKNNVITKLVAVNGLSKIACLFTSNKGNIGGLVIHKSLPRIYFRLSLTDCDITCSQLSLNGKRLFCGTSSDQLHTFDLTNYLS